MSKAIETRCINPLIVGCLAVLAMALIMCDRWVIWHPDASTVTRQTLSVISNTGGALFLLLWGASGIALTWRSMARLWLTVAVTALLGTCLAPRAEAGTDFEMIRVLLFPISGAGASMLHAWLLVIYLSPLLDFGLRALGRSKSLVLLTIMALITVWSLWIGWGIECYYLASPLTGTFLYIAGRAAGLGYFNFPNRLICVVSLILIGAFTVSYPWLRSFLTSSENLKLEPYVLANPFGILTALSALGLCFTRKEVHHAKAYLGPFITAVAACVLIYSPVAKYAVEEYSFFAIAAGCWAAAAGLYFLVRTTSQRWLSFISAKPIIYLTEGRQSEVIKNPLTRSHERDSRLELLRIIAISLIVMYHWIERSIPEYMLPYGVRDVISAFIIGKLAIFVMLIGMLGITFTWKSVIRIWLVVWIFNAVNLLLLVTGDGLGGIPIREALESLIWPLERGNYWFMRNYMALITLSPLINAALCRLNLRNLRIAVAFATIGYLWCGWLGAHDWKINGFALWSFLVLYILGWWLIREPFLRKISGKSAIGMYLLSSVILAGICLCVTDTDNDTNLFGERQYASIFALVSAIGIIIAVMRLKFKSRFINSLGAASLGCYLMQDGYYGLTFFYPWSRKVTESLSSGVEVTLFYIGVFIVTWAASWVVMKFCKYVTPIMADKLVSLIPKRLREDVNNCA